MIQEHALRKLEFYLHHYCLDQNIKPIIDNILTAANRGYSTGTYNIKGHYVSAPVESLDLKMVNTFEDLLWPFTTEQQAHRFLALLNYYFSVRGVRAEVLGVEGYSIK
ncbi:MAG TPA: hypothetical protein VGL56_18035 [Fimbriimonadaceae bacterium]|jgi:hypothetical protein